MTSRSFVVRIDPELLAAYDALAQRAGISRSEALRLQMRRAVDGSADLFSLSVAPGSADEGSPRRQDRAS